jgi:hypothetical protein
MKMKKTYKVSDSKKRNNFRIGTLIIPILFASMFLFLTSCITYVVSPPGYETQEYADPPNWAPYYEDINRVQYYYLPDIECYYNVWTHQFVYYMNGNWMFGQYLPIMYSWYDLNNCFVVLLHHHIHRPWLNHHHYCSNYPKYYHKKKYKDHHFDNDRDPRGFN